MDFQEALKYIESVRWQGSRPGLERISELMHRMNDPQKNLKFIHIAGTNGKGSCAAFFSNILREAGYKTGLFISPYVEVFNERIQINNRYISDEEFAKITEYVKKYADTMDDLPTEFELITAVAFDYFYRNNCDIVVLETGMGGEFDSTNVIGSPELAVITAIGYDHMEYLGDTLEKIASTKAGIIKKDCDVILYRQDDEIMQVIQRRCVEVGASLHISDPDALQLAAADVWHQEYMTCGHGNVTISLPAAYQKYNLAVVLKGIDVLNGMGYKISEDAIKKGLKDTRWPGRFEVLNEEPLFITDGAHNPHGMQAAVSSLKQLFGDKKLIIITGILADKDYDAMLDMILPLAGKVLCVSPENARALSPEKLLEEVDSKMSHLNEESCKVETSCFNDVESAVKEAFRTAEKTDVICCIGSLYLISDIKDLINSGRLKLQEL